MVSRFRGQFMAPPPTGLDLRWGSDRSIVSLGETEGYACASLSKVGASVSGMSDQPEWGASASRCENCLSLQQPGWHSLARTREG